MVGNSLTKKYAADISDKKEYEVRRFTVNFDVRHGQLVANRAKELLRFEEWCPLLPSVTLQSFSYHEEKRELTFLFSIPTFMSDPKHGTKTLCDTVAHLIAVAINDVNTEKELENLAKQDAKRKQMDNKPKLGPTAHIRVPSKHVATKPQPKPAAKPLARRVVR
jgi:hypothetical protein